MKSKLLEKHCKELRAGSPALKPAEARKLLAEVPNWKIEKRELVQGFSFKNFYETMAFVNAVAWIANQQNHHPDMEVGYNKCKVRFSTHSVGGLSENDFISAARVQALFS